MKDKIMSIKESQVTINSSTNGHVFNIKIEVKERPKVSIFQKMYKKSINFFNVIKKIITWLGIF
jgi:(p)ppGpp synthase/HD superfamily hydrolase